MYERDTTQRELVSALRGVQLALTDLRTLLADITGRRQSNEPVGWSDLDVAKARRITANGPRPIDEKTDAERATLERMRRARPQKDSNR